MVTRLGKTGIGIVDSLPWGTHLCQFYETKQDLLDVLVPYFKTGLENNELCVWITSRPLEESEAREAMMEAVPHFDSYVQREQMEIIPYTDWYLQDGSFSQQGVLDAASNRITAMADKGYSGIRASGNVGWLQKQSWEDFTRYEEVVGSLIGKHQMMTICSYPLAMCGVRESLDVMKNHRLALIKHQGVWQVIENSEQRRTELALRKTEEKYRNLFENTQDGMEVIDGSTGRILLSNQAAARMFGFDTPEDMVGVDPLDYIPQEDKERVASMMSEYMFEKDLHRVIELRAVTKDGRAIWLSAIGVRTEYEGRLAGLVSLRDVTEQKQTEQAFRDSVRHYRLLAENVSDVIWVTDMDLRPTHVSPSVTRLLGYSVEEALSRTLADLLTPASLETAKAAFSRALVGWGRDSSFEPPPLEVEVVRKDGSTIWVESTLSFMHDSSGQPVEAVGILHDVTERKRAEQTIRESERRYRLLAENVSDVIWVTDMDLRLTYISPSVTRLLGYTVEETMALRFEDALTSASAEVGRNALVSALAGRKEDLMVPQTLEMEMRRKDGSTVWAESTHRFVWDQNGQPFEVLGILRDITERRRADQSVRESERRYRLLADNISDVIWVTDMNLRPIYFSPSVTRLLGYSVEESMAGTVETRLTSASLEAATDTFARVLALEEREPGRLSGAGTLEMEFKHKDGSMVWADTTVSFLRDSAGRPVEILGILRDISERKKAEERLHHSLEVLERTIEGTVQAIASTAETKDRYTAGHQRRVSQLACAIAWEMGLSSDRMRVIRTAGLLHDLGKVSLPAEILSKPGKLTDIEFALIKTHPQAAYDILKNIESFGQIAKIVLQHHERMNGSGYPFGLRGEGILLEARILAVSDVVEAMLSHRPYRPALGLDKALEEIMQNSGTLYDPDVVSSCSMIFAGRGFQFDEEPR
jgi:PAS domain S-box-containing protein